MSETKSFPCETRLDIAFQDLEVIARRTVILMVENAGIIPTGN
ncbi:MAG TPA: hypothetical protein VIY66_08250 [Candidatus Acidoferrales bacterium]